MFVNATIVSIIILMLSALEYPLVITYIFTPRSRRHQLCAEYEQTGAKIIFDLFRAFRGFRLSVTNPRNLKIPSHCLVISNHQSLLDILVLISILGIERKPRFVAKKELQIGIPLVSFVLRKGGHSLIYRHGAPIDTMRIISTMAKTCAKEKACPTIFPEGTRSRNGVLGPFHSAGVRKILDVEALPVAAIAIDGGWRVATIRGFLRRFGRDPYRVDIVKIYDPPKGKSQIATMLEDAHKEIEASIAKMRASAAAGAE